MAIFDATEDWFDTRDIEERLREIEDVEIEIERGDEEDEESFIERMREEDSYLADEYQTLRNLQDEGRAAYNEVNWDGGITMVKDDHFPDYAEEYAREIGAIDREHGWPHQHIDWEAAAEELLIDYTSIEINGTTYWGRA